VEKMSKYARKKPDDDALYYLPEFEVLYTSGSPTLVYKPLQLKLTSVSPDEIEEVLYHYNDVDNWIPVDKIHLKQIKSEYDKEIPGDNAAFFAKLRQENGMPPYDDKHARKAFTSFESFYQLAAMPSKKII
jgi:hypothetical protein